MKLETERLELVALDARQLELWMYDLPALESELECSYRATPVKGAFRDVVAVQLKKIQNNIDDYIWQSFWLMKRRSDCAVVGSAGFKTPPDENGEVEIGYNLGREFEHNGFMTETVSAMCTWALSQDGVKHVVAETDLDGFASQRILKRCGFKETSRAQTIWWRL